jgi:hypothetical protein
MKNFHISVHFGQKSKIIDFLTFYHLVIKKTSRATVPLRTKSLRLNNFFCLPLVRTPRLLEEHPALQNTEYIYFWRYFAFPVYGTPPKQTQIQIQNTAPLDLLVFFSFQFDAGVEHRRFRLLW